MTCGRTFAIRTDNRDLVTRLDEGIGEGTNTLGRDTVIVTDEDLEGGCGEGGGCHGMGERN
jgi:hypothetical protein